ncbi:MULTISPECIES: toll/interleukin-1 receptor domain-containing protein [unclassified Bradyrhizobium]|uniref:toll/interleukin-1 receptor domain-containing protein n=1 Tax=unclassified Bradyrhizobium TaxID=2631580 RepID=UPI001CD64675|nr:MULTISPECIES: toll/interleukin-1 receptor domain-containing protein [unclassified Bradyrhizobium]MCA1378881.1 toll/interleukin-1 receptor domain-containing protein [Bradyrhizobium sp. IC4060]MCA1488985.1 toll/interleukin-1 receptor domain-containing protein [Bradyrhizobium sp. IC4061]
MKAFLSYTTANKAVAGKVKTLLETLGVECFLAHEDIQVSEEWRLTLLSELAQRDLFVSILSSDYFSSVWCAQESGIAAADPHMTIVPVSLDGTVPAGFFNHVQSIKIDGGNPQLSSFTNGLFRCDQTFTIDALIALLGKSRSYRSAEYHFSLLQPFVKSATDAQVAEVLRVSTVNDQVCHASECATKYLPPLLESHGHLLDPTVRKELGEILSRYKR